MPEVVSDIDDSPAHNGYQVNLTPGVKRTVTITARVAKKTEVKTDYEITFTRDRSVLGDLALCHGVQVEAGGCNADTGIGSDDGARIQINPAFAASTLRYTSTVPYSVDDVTVSAQPGALDKTAKYTTPSTTTQALTGH